MTNKYSSLVVVLFAICLGPTGAAARDAPPLLVSQQGSFAFGWVVITGKDGNTFHGDHGYAQSQIPTDARKYPLVMWHGGGQFSKTWESTPDGREGFQNISLRRGWATYIIDQPRRGRSGRTTVGTTITDGVPDEANMFNIFRLGLWIPPATSMFFPGFSFRRMQTRSTNISVNTGPESFDAATRAFHSDAVSALFDKIGPAVLITHPNSGQYGWRTAMKNDNVKAIVAYEPVTFAYPASDPSDDVRRTTSGLLLSPFLIS